MCFALWTGFEVISQEYKEECPVVLYVVSAGIVTHLANLAEHLPTCLQELLSKVVQ